ncbi:MAG TPA: hypothetical protein VIY09_04275 [Rhizomicrobium sp.]
MHIAFRGEAKAFFGALNISAASVEIDSKLAIQMVASWAGVLGLRALEAKLDRSLNG